MPANTCYLNKLKLLSFVLLVLFGSAFGEECLHPERGNCIFTDTRDGKEYGLIKIGSRIWMTENSNYNYGTSLLEKINGKSYCYDNDKTNCGKYGRLYDWSAAQGACPGGWELPTFWDWAEVEEYPQKLAILTGGYKAGKSYYDTDFRGIWWTKSECGSNSIYYWEMLKDNSKFISGCLVTTERAYSVRCVRDAF